MALSINSSNFQGILLKSKLLSKFKTVISNSRTFQGPFTQFTISLLQVLSHFPSIHFFFFLLCTSSIFHISFPSSNCCLIIPRPIFSFHVQLLPPLPRSIYLYFLPPPNSSLCLSKQYTLQAHSLQTWHNMPQRYHFIRAHE